MRTSHYIVIPGSRLLLASDNEIFTVYRIAFPSGCTVTGAGPNLGLFNVGSDLSSCAPGERKVFSADVLSSCPSGREAQLTGSPVRTCC